MPSALAKPEVIVGQALDVKEIHKPSAGSPEARVRVVLKKRLAESGPKSALEAVANPAPDQTTSKRTIVRAIGWEMENGQIVREGPTRARFERTLQRQEDYDSFYKNGFDKSTDPQKKFFREALEAQLVNVEGMSSYLAQLTAPERQQFIDNILREPGVGINIIKKNTDALGRVVSSESLMDFKQRLEEARAAQAQIEQRISNNSTARGTVSKAESRFRPKGSSQIELSSLDTQIQNLRRTEMPEQIEGKLSRLAEEEERLDERLPYVSDQETIRKINSRLEQIPAQREELISKLPKAQENKEQLEQAVARKMQMEEEKARLPEERTRLEEEEASLQVELEAAKRATVTSQANFDLERIKREDQEVDFEAGINNAAGEGIREFIKERITEVEEARDEAYEEEIKNMEDPAEKSIGQQCLSRWNEFKETKKKGKVIRRKYVQKQDQIRADWKIGLDSGGKDIVQDMLTKSGLTPDEQLAKLDDPEFMKKAQRKVMERLIGERIKMKQFTGDDAQFIAESPWGEGIVQAAIERNNKVKEEVAKMFGEDIIKPNNFGEWLKKQNKGKLLLIFLLIFGSGFLAFGPLYMGAKQQMQEG